MKRKLWPALVLGLVLLSAAVALADGDIYSGGPLGTKITSLPYIITTPGAYYLGGSLTAPSGSDGITINADNVTLDLMGFCLTFGGGIQSGVYMNGRTNVEIRNGELAGWNFGVLENGASGSLHRIINIRCRACDYGVRLKGDGHLISGCQAVGNPSSYGFLIEGGTGAIVGCLAQDFNNSAIKLDNGGIVRGNVATFSGTTPAESNGIIISNSNPDRNFLVRGNEVNNFKYGINFYNAALLSNTVTMGSLAGSIGIYGDSLATTVLDQNTVLQNATAGSTSFTAFISGVQTRNNNAKPNGRF